VTEPAPLGRLPAQPISRRALLRGAAGGIVTLALGTEAKSASGSPAPPNILFILADDLGYADVACYGRPDIRTPNIDRLAGHGVRFLQGYANSAVCTATRVGLITGRYQDRLRIGLEEPLVNNADVGLEPSHPTLPSLLKKAGYSTTLIGSGIWERCRSSVRSRADTIIFMAFGAAGSTITRMPLRGRTISGTMTSRCIRRGTSPSCWETARSKSSSDPRSRASRS
jgi:Sulfatase